METKTILDGNSSVSNFRPTYMYFFSMKKYFIREKLIKTFTHIKICSLSERNINSNIFHFYFHSNSFDSHFNKIPSSSILWYHFIESFSDIFHRYESPYSKIFHLLHHTFIVIKCHLCPRSKMLPEAGNWSMSWPNRTILVQSKHSSMWRIFLRRLWRESEQFSNTWSLYWKLYWSMTLQSTKVIYYQHARPISVYELWR